MFDDTKVLGAYLKWCSINDDACAKNSQWMRLSDSHTGSILNEPRFAAFTDACNCCSRLLTDCRVQLGGKAANLIVFHFLLTVFKIELDSFRQKLCYTIQGHCWEGSLDTLFPNLKRPWYERSTQLKCHRWQDTWVISTSDASLKPLEPSVKGHIY